MEKQLNILPLKDWGLPGNIEPLVIAGPCSAETEEQVLATARLLAASGIRILRAGIWKPRTRPNSFEGVGTVGLQWLKKAKAETGMFTTTEVANRQHVFEALKHGIDILWIGARTTANPFAMQEIADAIKGADVPVLIKNPVNPDVELWLGAIERIYEAGINRIGAIHRGFSTYGKNVYRNPPHWQVPIDLHRRMPEIPLLVDPSHICGNRTMLKDITQKSLDLNFDGLIIEVHHDPDNAWSDAKQQITPAQLSNLLDELVLRKEKTTNAEFLQTIEELRSQIDKFDEELLDILASRMEVAETIGKYKMKNSIKILQPGRWKEILSHTRQMGEARNLSTEFVETVFMAIHQESINKQMKIMNNGQTNE